MAFHPILHTSHPRFTTASQTTHPNVAHLQTLPTYDHQRSHTPTSPADIQSRSNCLTLDLLPCRRCTNSPSPKFHPPTRHIPYHTRCRCNPAIYPTPAFFTTTPRPMVHPYPHTIIQMVPSRPFTLPQYSLTYPSHAANTTNTHPHQVVLPPLPQ